MYKVYIHITPNNKKYIGITKDTKKRWRCNGYGYKNSVFYSAIEKYGWNNIKHGIIADGLTLEEAEEMESLLISFLNTTSNDKGYNVRTTGFIANPNPSKNFRENISKKNSGFNNRKSKPIICFQNGIVYESIHIAARELGLKVTNIIRVLTGRNKQTGGFTFEYANECDKKEKIKTLTQQQVIELHMKKVAVYSTDGELIKICKSRTEASKLFGISALSICNCINGYRMLSGKYVFKDASGKVYKRINKVLTKDIIGANNPSARAIDCFSNDGSFLKHYEYASLAAEELKCDLSTIIKVCKGKLRTHKGYIFKYSDNMKNKIENNSKLISWEERP